MMEQCLCAQQALELMQEEQCLDAQIKSEINAELTAEKASLTIVREVVEALGYGIVVWSTLTQESMDVSPFHKPINIEDLASRMMLNLPPPTGMVLAPDSHPTSQSTTKTASQLNNSIQQLEDKATEVQRRKLAAGQGVHSSMHNPANAMEDDISPTTPQTPTPIPTKAPAPADPVLSAIMAGLEALGPVTPQMPKPQTTDTLLPAPPSKATIPAPPRPQTVLPVQEEAAFPALPEVSGATRLNNNKPSQTSALAPWITVARANTVRNHAQTTQQQGIPKPMDPLTTEVTVIWNGGLRSQDKEEELCHLRVDDIVMTTWAAIERLSAIAPALLGGRWASSANTSGNFVYTFNGKLGFGQITPYTKALITPLKVGVLVPSHHWVWTQLRDVITSGPDGVIYNNDTLTAEVVHNPVLAGVMLCMPAHWQRSPDALLHGKRSKRKNKGKSKRVLVDEGLRLGANTFDVLTSLPKSNVIATDGAATEAPKGHGDPTLSPYNLAPRSDLEIYANEDLPDEGTLHSSYVDGSNSAEPIALDKAEVGWGGIPGETECCFSLRAKHAFHMGFPMTCAETRTLLTKDSKTPEQAANLIITADKLLGGNGDGQAITPLQYYTMHVKKNLLLVMHKLPKTPETAMANLRAAGPVRVEMVINYDLQVGGTGSGDAFFNALPFRLADEDPALRHELHTILTPPNSKTAIGNHADIVHRFGKHLVATGQKEGPPPDHADSI
ncbi:hypothetical protein EI94DRAFT_1707982 [Lactarius quietus]|nr:hypothetical protein EI94DRAFT_1707982 [Lactarius quietus]